MHVFPRLSILLLLAVPLLALAVPTNPKLVETSGSKANSEDPSFLRLLETTWVCQCCSDNACQEQEIEQSTNPDGGSCTVDGEDGSLHNCREKSVRTKKQAVAF